MTKDRIEREFDAFFEFPTEDKSTVSSTSAKLFARQIADVAIKESNLNEEAANEHAAGLESEILRLRAAIEKTINENLHLADGDDCTLIDLVRALEPCQSHCGQDAKGGAA